MAKRRWWLVGLVAAWAVVLGGLSVWSVRHEKASVPEQRDIADAVPELQQAAGVLFAAADADGRALVLGGLELIGDCRITPVRSGVVAARDLTVYVRDGEARTALDAIANGLPPGYLAEVAANKGGTRLGFHADAGNFIGIDGNAEATAKVLTLRLSSGCRPDSDQIPGETDPGAGAPPAAFDAVLAALGGGRATPEVQAVNRPDAGVAASWSVELDEPADLAQRLRLVSAGATLLRSDASAWAYRTDNTSVVVVPDGKQVRVTVTQ
ncbi:hypothetical protein BJ973_007670 [Actinoplanes tereljensis]|uniref:Uncharacterized protein n=1 Tax=Paractinoplanes tereljensis TaxID=571912 RepID=A0A919NSB0_9ACTN|nr:hypothetical protein [Actinoplanes tereljensis]GIF24190.1 hypothetical protein Ate02nite_69200 [Actinoplanes tereljensis]